MLLDLILGRVLAKLLSRGVAAALEGFGGAKVPPLGIQPAPLMV